MLRPFSGFLTRLLGGLIPLSRKADATATWPSVRALRLAESMADIEYAIKTHETFKRLFSDWLRFHIVISLVLYGLLALHVWAAVYFGLRWFT